MKVFLQAGEGKTFLLLLRKRTLATFAAILCMMALMPLSAGAQSAGAQKKTIVNIIGQDGRITRTSTVYVGEVVLDGQQSFYYLYSEDITQGSTVLGALKGCLFDFEDGIYSNELVSSLVGDGYGIAVCSNPAYESMMNSDWMSAGNAGLACLPNVTATSSSSENLFETNAVFAEHCTRLLSDYGIILYDEVGETLEVSSVLGVLASYSTDDTHYGIVNGDYVEIIDRTITYSYESITVVYTRAEFETPMTETPLTFEAVEGGTIIIENPNGLTIEYNKNNAGWTSTSADPISIAVAANDVVAFRGNNSCYWASGDSGETPTRFTATNPCYVYGNVMSLVHASDYATNTSLTEEFALAYLFTTPTNDFYSFYENNSTILSHDTKELVLPATSVPESGYMYMFAGCQGITRAPELPATTIGMGSYHQMFADCSGLVTVPEELPATTLGLYCYDNMFFGCTSIEVAPQLPATALADGCYMGMFSGCTSLITAPALPATTLAEDCYHRMFEGCTSLTKAPDLPAATLFGQVYGGMFDGCTSLNYVKCLATDLGENVGVYSSVADWLNNVSPTGTFVKNPDMNDWLIGTIDGIPAGWTVEDDMYSMPLTFEAVESGTIAVTKDEYSDLTGLNIQYKKNDGALTDVVWNENISLAAGDVISFHGSNGTCYNDENWSGFHIECSNNCYVYGNIMSIIDKDGYVTNTTLTKTYAFYQLFQKSDFTANTTILNHPTKDLVLPATTLTVNCYDAMFYDCQGLTRAPALPATTMTDWCYNAMFKGCTNLATAPQLPATALAEFCYMEMFSGCTNIAEAPKLPATTLANSCYADMFMGCTSLTKAPNLPAETLVEACYIDMFAGCTNLNYVKCLATDISADYCTVNWLDDVAATGTFVKAQGMTAWTTGVDGIPAGWTVESIGVFTTEGDWNVAANWSGNAVPSAGSDVVIAANATIPANYVANAGEISINAGATLTIADGGQLYHTNAGVTATVQKTITAYTPNTKDGWHLIGYSFAGSGAVDEMDNLTTNDYDLYYYDEPTHYWINQEDATNNFTELEAAKGYLYANSQTQTIGLKGTLRTATEMVNLPLSYTEAADNLKGFNLVGNPFAHNVTSYTGTNVAEECYQLNDLRNEVVVGSISTTHPLKPAEGFFVKATAADASITFNSGAKGERTKTNRINLEISENGQLVDRLIVKQDGEPLEKLTLRENGTRIFAMNGQQEMAVVIAEGNEQPINFKAAENGIYTLSVNTENTELRYLHLIDNLTGADVDLLALRPFEGSQGPQAQGLAEYTFEAKTSDYASRFRLVFSANETDGPSTPSTGSGTFAFISNGNIIITADVDGATLQVIDVTGHVIVSGDAMNRVSTNRMTPGVYVLRLINGDNVMTQKIVVR